MRPADRVHSGQQPEFIGARNTVQGHPLMSYAVCVTALLSSLDIIDSPSLSGIDHLPEPKASTPGI